jgi:serine/threonine protein kinase
VAFFQTRHGPEQILWLKKGDKGVGDVSMFTKEFSSNESIEQKYQFSTETPLGRGAFSHVYLGKCLINDQPVAVKRVDRTKLVKGQHRRLLQNEIEILLMLSHPGIVHLFDHETSPDYITLYLEYCNQGSLQDHLQQHGTLTMQVIRHIMFQLSAVLAYIHKRNVVHRDIKPANILVHGKDKLELAVIKLADFGFARHLPAQDMAVTFCGSPLYMAPEVLSGAAYDVMVDMWGAGIVAYQCMVGHAPYHAQSMRELRQQLRERQEHIDYPTNVCPKFRDLVGKLLRLDPVARLSGEDMRRHPFFVDRQRTISEPIRRAPSPSTTVLNRSLPPIDEEKVPSLAVVGLGGSTLSFEIIDRHHVEINQLADALEPRPTTTINTDLLRDRLVLLDSVQEASRQQTDNPIHEIIVKGRLLLLLRDTLPIACFGSSTDIRHYRELFNQTITRIGELKKAICTQQTPHAPSMLKSAEELLYNYAMVEAQHGACHEKDQEDYQGANSYMRAIVLLIYLKSIASDRHDSQVLDQYITSTHTRMRLMSSSAVRFCGACGTGFEASHRFCSFCGSHRDHYDDKVKGVVRSLLGSDKEKDK